MSPRDSSSPRDASEDRRYCRDVLPRVSRTFALNIRLLNGEFGESVRVAYLLCRAADALEDSWPNQRGAIVRGRFERFLAALAGGEAALADLASEAASLDGSRADLSLVAHLHHVMGAFRALPKPHHEAVRAGVEVLASGMARFAARAADRPEAVPYLDTEAELHEYCYVVAGCVGEMLTRLFETTHGAGSPDSAARRLTLSPIVGEALQLTNILLDWPSDIRRGRCYVPRSWLADQGLVPSDLVGRDRTEVRAIADRLEALARRALARVPDYLDHIPPPRVRYRLFCLLPAVWALGSLRNARRDPEFPWGARRPRLPRSELWRSSLATLVAVGDSRAVRRMLGGAESAPAAVAHV
jgi:4,4'-diapophytoene synthase